MNFFKRNRKIKIHLLEYQLKGGKTKSIAKFETPKSLRKIKRELKKENFKVVRVISTTK